MNGLDTISSLKVPAFAERCESLNLKLPVAVGLSVQCSYCSVSLHVAAGW